MRNGGTAWFTFTFGKLKPTAQDADPVPVEVEMRVPDDSKQVWTYGLDPEIVRDSVGHYHMETPPMDHPAGGTYTLLARGPGYPETRCEIKVEPAYW